MAQLQLEGNVDRRDEMIVELQKENDRLQSLVFKLQGELRTAQGDSARAVQNLRRVLGPLYLGLKQVFGEMDAIALEEDLPNSTDLRKSAVWETWKKKLGGKQAEFIQALLDHGEMTSIQLKVTTHSGTQTVYDTCSKLNKLGLIHKNGNKYALKEL